MSPMPPRNHCLLPEAIAERLQQKGIQPTPQRVAIGRYVLCEGDHPTADDVKTWADAHVFPRISLATIYNTLGTLVEAGLLQAVGLPQSSKVCYDANTEPHHHMICMDSGRLLDLAPHEAQVSLNLPADWQAQGFQLFVQGRHSPR